MCTPRMVSSYLSYTHTHTYTHTHITERNVSGRWRQHFHGQSEQSIIPHPLPPSHPHPLTLTTHSSSLHSLITHSPPSFPPLFFSPLTFCLPNRSISLTPSLPFSPSLPLPPPPSPSLPPPYCQYQGYKGGGKEGGCKEGRKGLHS